MKEIFKWEEPWKLGRLLSLVILICSFGLAACSEGTATSTGPTTTTAAASGTPGITGGTGSGIQAQAGDSGGQPLPTPTPPGPDGRKVLTIWTAGWKGQAEYEKFLNDQIDNYRTRNRQMTVDWQDFGDELGRKFEEAVSKPGQTPPDIVLFNVGDLYQFGAAGSLTDLATLGGSGLKEDYAATPFEALRVGSVQYGLPWLASTRVTIINKKLWQQATLDPTKTPRTFQELEPLLPTLAKNTPPDVIACWVKPIPLTDFMMEDAPVYTISGDGKAPQTAFPSPATLAKWQFYQERNRGAKQFFDRDGLGKGYADALKKYTANQLVMVLDGAPLLPGLKNANAELYNNTLVVPHLTGKANLLPLDLQGWAISKTSRQATEALAFLKFLNTPENQLAVAKLSGLSIPTLKKGLSDPYVTSQDEPLGQARSIMAASLDRTRPPELSLPAPLKTTDREKLLTALYNAQSDIWNKDTLPKDALAAAAKVWGEVLK